MKYDIRLTMYILFRVKLAIYLKVRRYINTCSFSFLIMRRQLLVAPYILIASSHISAREIAECLVAAAYSTPTLDKAVINEFESLEKIAKEVAMFSDVGDFVKPSPKWYDQFESRTVDSRVRNKGYSHIPHQHLQRGFLPNQVFMNYPNDSRKRKKQVPVKHIVRRHNTHGNDTYHFGKRVQFPKRDGNHYAKL